MMRDSAPHIPFVDTGSYPPRGGNLLRPLVDGTPVFRRIAEAVEQARHSVWLTVAFYAHDFEMPEGRGSLFDLLDRAVERGLDAWATVGSCNLHGYSLQGHSELNASIWDAKIVGALRSELLAEHLDTDCTAMNDREALTLYREIARKNRYQRDARWRGLAFALDPTTYGE
jgi:phosphatidylserine/phosphatidylglycerophosphate/cardiolipin synthase-like enzyme